MTRHCVSCILVFVIFTHGFVIVLTVVVLFVLRHCCTLLTKLSYLHWEESCKNVIQFQLSPGRILLSFYIYIQHTVVT